MIGDAPVKVPRASGPTLGVDGRERRGFGPARVLLGHHAPGRERWKRQSVLAKRRERYARVVESGMLERDATLPGEAQPSRAEHVPHAHDDELRVP